MKKILSILVLMICCFVPSVMASSATLQKEQIANNQVKVGIQSEFGYVTSLHTKIQLAGNVKLQSFGWNEKLTAGDYKKYIYDASANTLEVYIVTANKRNLANENGTVEMGNITVVPNTKTEEYTVSLISPVTLVNQSYQKLTTDANSGADIKFIAKIEDTTDQPENGDNTGSDNNGNSGSSNTGDSNTTPGNQTTPGSNNSSQTTNGNNTAVSHQVTNNSETEEPTENSNPIAQEPVDPDQTSGSDEIKDNTADKEETQKEFENKIAEEKKNKNNTWIAIISGSIVGIVVIGGIAFWMMKRRK